MSTPIKLSDLHPDDLADLRRSGLSDETIAFMNCYSADGDTIRSRTGVDKVDGSGYCIPYAEVTDQTGERYVRWRLRQPIEKMRYVAGRGDDPQLYISPAFAALPAADFLVVTEGEKKAAKAVQEGIHCVAVQGVWNGFDAASRAVEKINGNPVTENTAPLSALLDMAKKYKRVLVLGDSDLIPNFQARQGLEILTRALSSREIRTGLAFCPPAIIRDGSETKIKKQGLDDWLIADRSLVVRSLPALFRAAEVNRDGITDSFNAREFTELFRGQLAYSQGLWRYWNDSIWVVDDCEKRRTLMPKVADIYISDADKLSALLSKVTSSFAGLKGDQLPLEIISWTAPISAAIKGLRDSAKKICNLRGIDAALALAKFHLRVADEVWNSDPYLLAVWNGVIDLRTGKLLPSQPELWITRSAGAAYDPDAVPSRFLKFLEQVQPDAQVRDYIQRLAGYSAVGRSNEQKFFTLVGSGANGKSTYMGLIMDALGGYAVKGPLSLLAEQSPDRPRNDLAALSGARLVSISETPENLRIDEAIVKAVTGQDVISARFLNREFFQFRPCFTPVLDTNHSPRPRDHGEGIWRRLVIVPWPVMIPAEQRNKNLRENLLEELPGILAWIIEGAKAYLKSGLPDLPRLTEATQSLRDSCDDLGRWLEACVERGPEYHVQSSVLYESFRAWCRVEGSTYSVSQQKFSQRLREKGFKVEKRHGGLKIWDGLQLREQQKDLNSVEHAVNTEIKVAHSAAVITDPADDESTVEAGSVHSQVALLRIQGEGLII
jgi:putative DNA primase/helicase